MKVTNAITTTLLIFTSIATNVLPAQSVEVGGEFDIEKNLIAKDLKKFPDIHCNIAVTVFVSVARTSTKVSLDKKYLDASENFVNSACESHVERDKELEEVMKNPVYAKENVQHSLTLSFMELRFACIQGRVSTCPIKY
jgi:hypothetical protein